MDFLLLSLEFNAPDPVLDWARAGAGRVPGPPGDRRDAQLRRHAGGLTTQVGRGGRREQRAGDLWSELVRPSCSVFLVVNGHFSDEVTAEARRTDTNACGQPVQAMLSDYQDRPRGGDGWLRYLTFDPGADEIRAFTYSPFLGQFETDADSQFTVPYDMSEPADLPGGRYRDGRVGLGRVGPGPGAAPGHGGRLVRDGRRRHVGHARARRGRTRPRRPDRRRSPRTPSRGPSPNGWGTADTGGAWTVGGGTTRFSVGVREWAQQSAAAGGDGRGDARVRRVDVVRRLCLRRARPGAVRAGVPDGLRAGGRERGLRRPREGAGHGGGAAAHANGRGTVLTGQHAAGPDAGRR